MAVGVAVLGTEGSSQVLKAFGNNASVPTGYDPESCFSCLGNVSFLNSMSYELEHLVCTQQGVLKRCGGTTIVSDDGLSCRPCPKGQYASDTRDQCILCLAGTYASGNGCVACDPNLELCDRSGLTAPLQQVLSCAEGSMLYLSKSALVPNQCQPCQECSGSTPYTWFEEGHNMSNACIQKMGESSVHYFACYSTNDVMTQFSGDSLSPAFQNKQYRLTFKQGVDTYNLNQNQVVVQACDDRYALFAFGDHDKFY